MSAQQPVQTELLMRHHQLQSRLATLKIENEEVRVHTSLRGLKVASGSITTLNEAKSLQICYAQQSSFLPNQKMTYSMDKYTYIVI